MNLNGDTADLGDAEVAAFRSALRGELLDPSEDDYDAARRVWNGNIDRRPALIARCAGVSDVQRAVVFAREHALTLSVRGGGHSAPGYGTNDGGLVIDLSRMKGIRVDPEARTARAEGGALWCDFDHETQAFGLATTGGTVSNTGIGPEPRAVRDERRTARPTWRARKSSNARRRTGVSWRSGGMSAVAAGTRRRTLDGSVKASP